LAGDTASSQDEIERTRSLLESRLRERPDDVYALLQLSWVNVALQRNADALRLAHRATELVPVEKDALLGPTYLACLAEIQARTGEPAEAVKKSEMRPACCML
jgi:cytochrome c-type biogenesis protein CcmH/NrfG